MGWNIVSCKNSVTLVTAKTIKLLYCARTRTREEMDYRSFHNSHSLCSMRDFLEFIFTSRGGKWPVVLWKVTCRFMESDVLFYRKWRIVLWKVMCCFIENDVLFYGKWRVVLWKTTYCFMKIDPSFYGKRPVVLWKVTRRFMESDLSFYGYRP